MSDVFNNLCIEIDATWDSLCNLHTNMIKCDTTDGLNKLHNILKVLQKNFHASVICFISVKQKMNEKKEKNTLKTMIKTVCEKVKDICMLYSSKSFELNVWNQESGIFE
jgi:hypothetical protein